MNDGTGFIFIGFVLDMRCFLFYLDSIITFLLLIFDVRAAYFVVPLFWPIDDHAAFPAAVGRFTESKPPTPNRLPVVK